MIDVSAWHNYTLYDIVQFNAFNPFATCTCTCILAARMAPNLTLLLSSYIARMAPHLTLLLSSGLRWNLILTPLLSSYTAAKMAPKELVIVWDHNEHKCPYADCSKSFRKLSLLQSHVKHYHVTPSPPAARNRTSPKQKPAGECCMYMYIYTVEPPIKDTIQSTKKSLSYSASTFLTSE